MILEARRPFSDSKSSNGDADGDGDRLSIDDTAADGRWHFGASRKPRPSGSIVWPLSGAAAVAATTAAPAGATSSAPIDETTSPESVALALSATV